MTPLKVRPTADLTFEGLYRRHRGELYRWLLRETGDPQIAEDVLQTAFLHAYRALLDGTPPREPRSWLFAIARNANRGRFRRQRVIEADYDEDLPLTRDDSDGEPGVHELKEALATLPPNQRAAIVLQEVGGFSYAEIAERLGLTVGSVQMLVFRARRKLRAELLGERRLGGLFLPVQPLLNLLSRLAPAGDRAVLLRGAAGVAGAVAIGGGILATPSDGSPPIRGEAKTTAAQVAPAAASQHGVAAVRRPARAAATVPARTTRTRSAGRRDRTADEPTDSPATPAAAPAAAPQSTPPSQPLPETPVTRAVRTPVLPSLPKKIQLPAQPALPLPPLPALPPASQPPPVELPQLPPLPLLPPPPPPPKPLSLPSILAIS